MRTKNYGFTIEVLLFTKLSVFVVVESFVVY